MEVSSTGGAHKSTVVLAGSIIETILLDHLVSTDHHERTGNDPTKFEFWKLIETCNAEGVISDRTKQLLHAVRDYRNLIHPGRSLRLKEKLTPGIANVAHGVVGVVTAEVAERPNSRYGMTAEQALTKARQDPKILGMVKHLLSELRSSELDRLVVKALPAAFLDGTSGPDDEVPNALAELYQAAFSRSSEAARRTRVEDLCHAIQNASGATVHVLLANTFVGWHLQYAPPGKHRLILDRLLVESRGSELPFPATTYEGLLNVLPIQDVMEFITEHKYRINRWPPNDRTLLGLVLLKNPNYVLHKLAPDKETALAHYSEVVQEIKTLQGRPSRAVGGASETFAAWLEVIIDGDIPF